VSIFADTHHKSVTITIAKFIGRAIAISIQYYKAHKKVKASHTRYRALGPELIPVKAVRPQVTISHPPGGRLPLLFARPAVTFLAAEHHRSLAGTTLYCLVTEAHRCEQHAQGSYAAFAPRKV